VAQRVLDEVARLRSTLRHVQHSAD
jgi:hypothetical protein